MKQSTSMTQRLWLRSSRGIRSRNAVLVATIGVSAMALSACSSAPTLADERVANSETVVMQARQTVQGSESGAMELQRAGDQLAIAKKALSDKQPQQAERAAIQAQLHAELAIAKAESAAARRSADEVLASVESLRKEAERNSPTTR